MKSPTYSNCLALALALAPKEHNAADGSPKSKKKCETLSSPKQSSEDHFWDYEQRLLGARNEKKRSVLLAHEHFLSERNDTDARS